MTATNHLLSLLASQRDVLSRLLEHVRDERQCLLNNRIDQLDLIISNQAALLAQQHQLSTRITRTLTRIGAEMQLDGRMSLARIAEHLPSPAAEQARAYYRTLTNLAEELQREGRVNWHLAQQALNYVDFTLRLIGQVKSGPLPYVPPTQRDGCTPMQLMLDSCA